MNRNGPFETSPFLQTNLGSDYPTMSSGYSNSSNTMLPYANSQYGTMQSQYRQNSPLLPQSPYRPYQNNGNYYNKNSSDYYMTDDYSGGPAVDIEPGQDYNQQYRNDYEYDYDYVDYSKKIE